MNIDIEKAKISDIDKLEVLYNDICDYLYSKEYNPGWRKGYFPTKKEILYFLKCGALYAAKSDDKIIGSIALTHNPNGEVDENSHITETEYADTFFIHIFAVHPNYLRKGVGTAILNFAEQLCKQQNIKAIRLYVYEKNSVAIKAYERNGYVYIDKADIGLSQYGLNWFYLYEKIIH